MRHLPLLPLSLLLISLTPQSNAQILVNDTFADGERATQNLPSSVQLFSGGLTADTAVISNVLEVNNISAANITRGVNGHFTISGTPLQLGVGDKVRLSFDFRLPGSNVDADKAFQFMLLDSGATRVAADNHSFNNSAFSNDYGYGVTASLNRSASGRYRLVERTNDGTPTNNLVGDQLNLAVGASGLQLTAGGGAPTYAAFVEITRTASGVDLLGSINNVTVSFSDTTGNLYTAFDEFAIYSISGGVVGSPNISEFDVDNILITTTVVPEPSGLLYLCLGAGLVLTLRRQRSFTNRPGADAHHAS